MWQEARKHERHIRSVLVDYRKRAERRLNFYSQIRQDPIKFLRVYGTPAKINLDVEVRKAAENPNNMMPWTGDPSIMIDRFDARANLETYSSAKPTEIKLSTAEKIEERLCNYERYRCLAHNDFLEVTESMALKQIEREEKYGDTLQRKHDDDSKDKKPSEPKAAIGFTYEDGEIVSGRSSAPPPSKRAPAAESGSEDSDMDSDMDIDVELDLESLTAEQRQELIDHSHTYGMKRSDFIRLLDADQVLETELRMAKLLEEEKSQHLRKPRRRPHPRVRQPFDKYSAPVHGPKIGLLNGQPITRRKVYLSGASSDSESYGSPSSEEDERLRDRARRYRNTPTSQLARTKPALFESKRPAVLIGGLTLVAFCDPKKRRRRFRERPRRKYGEGAGSRSRSSSSSGDSRGSSNRPHRSSKRSKVEYITTFGEGDDEDDQDVGRGLSPSKFPGCAPSSSGRPSDTASKLAASVVSSLFKDSASAGHKSATPSASAACESLKTKPTGSTSSNRRLPSSSSLRRRSSSSRSSSPSKRRYSRRPRRSSSRSSTRCYRRRSSSSSSRSTSPVQKDSTAAFRNRSRSRSGGEAEAAPIKRYYRRDLESDDDKNKLSSSSSSDSDSEHKPSSSSANCASTSYYAQRRSTATEPDGRRRYLDSQDETSDFLSGGNHFPCTRDQVPVVKCV
uniref:DRY_EERY domain-containing protein n=1 Tax=Mesocestoides corti TaxID=53468 RepID=A0A5K3EX18_MESCO